MIIASSFEKFASVYKLETSLSLHVLSPSAFVKVVFGMAVCLYISMWYVCMHGWMDGWIDGLMDGWVVG
jgi:hypothetical protein